MTKRRENLSLKPICARPKTKRDYNKGLSSTVGKYSDIPTKQ